MVTQNGLQQLNSGAVRMLNLRGRGAQFARSRCSIWGGILNMKTGVYTGNGGTRKACPWDNDYFLQSMLQYG